MDIDFTPDKSLFPFESHFFDSSVGRVHYIDEGQGTPILFLHGNPTWSFLYRHIVSRLRDRFRCIAVDYPGFGLSTRPEGYGYTPQEHAGVLAELVDGIDLDGFIVMAQDWGGPIGTKIATDRADRVRGLVLGNTWFWPVEVTIPKVFSRVMSTGFMQRKILHNNLFVERLMPAGMSRKLTAAEMDHYRKVQPTAEARKGVAEFPRQILAAEPMLAELARTVPEKLGGKPVLLVWGMKDFAFRPKVTVPRMQRTFSDHRFVALQSAKHYIQEDAPDQISDAITERFG